MGVAFKDQRRHAFVPVVGVKLLAQPGRDFARAVEVHLHGTGAGIEARRAQPFVGLAQKQRFPQLRHALAQDRIVARELNLAFGRDVAFGAHQPQKLGHFGRRHAPARRLRQFAQSQSIARLDRVGAANLIIRVEHMVMRRHAHHAAARLDREHLVIAVFRGAAWSR